jgi:hypothetical protein
MARGPQHRDIRAASKLNGAEFCYSQASEERVVVREVTVSFDHGSP